MGAGAGPYATVLVEEIAKPGVEAVTMFRNVQRVRATIRQEPYLGFSALGDVYLAGKDAKPPEPAPTQARLSEAAEAWDRTKDTTNIAILEAFIARFKDTFLAELAHARIDELKKQQVVIATAPPSAARPTAKCDGVEITAGQNERRCFKPGAGKAEQFKDCPTCPEMVVVPAGSFTMGSPENEPERSSGEVQVHVSIAARRRSLRGYLRRMGRLYRRRRLQRLRALRSGMGRGRLPVINVSPEWAKTYTAWLLRKTGKTYRFLSEAEREYVTRAGTTTPFWWGSSITPKQANYDGSAGPYKGGGSKGDYRQRTVPVGSFEPNPWGLYNVHGNVLEVTEDCWNDSNIGNPSDGRARITRTCTDRVARGGPWYLSPQALRSAARHSDSFDLRGDGYGFRVARTLDP